MLATAAALLLAFVPGDAPVRFAPNAYRLASEPVDEPLYFPPNADQLMAEAGARGMVPFWGGFGVSLAIDGAVAIGLAMASADYFVNIWAISIGVAVEILLKPLLIALTESKLAENPGLFWPAACAAYLGAVVAAALFGAAFLVFPNLQAANMLLIASGAAFVLAIPGLTAWPVSLRWSF